MGAKPFVTADRGAAFLDAIIESPKPRSLFTRVDSLLGDSEPINWSIGGMFPRGSLVAFTGPSATYKSFIGCDMACSLASGKPWFDRPTRFGPAFMLAGEGQRGLAKRFRAWSLFHSVSLESAPLYTSTRLPPMAVDPTAWVHIADEIDSLRDQFQSDPELVIVDTVARAMAGANENSAEDMGKLIGSLDSIRDRFGCSVLCVHHSGKDEAKGARGSSSFYAALDAEFRVKCVNSLVTLSSSKAKDWDPPEPIHFRPHVQTLDVMGEDGQPETSVVLVPAELGPDINAAKRRQAQELKAEGRSLRDIESITGISKSTLSRFLK